MNTLILAPKLTPYDAVSDDALAMYRILSEKDTCRVHAEYKDVKNVEYISDAELKKTLRDEKSLLIYHHNVYWEAGKNLLKNARCKITFRYHNITPPSFFEKYSEIYEYACQCGMELTSNLIRDFPKARWLCCSQYNAQYLTGVPKEKVSVCPTFNKAEDLAKLAPDANILQNLKDSSEINLLFVGRVVPNKGHLFLVDVLRHYVKGYGSKIKLRIIGTLDKQLEGYYQEIVHKLRVYNLQDCVEFIFKASEEALLAYYKGSDFLVVASQHEGFFLPAVEAQYLKLPVIARSCGAVPETLGEDQLLLRDDPSIYAAAIHTLSENKEYRDFLVAAGFDNYQKRFTFEKISKTFTDFATT